LNLGPSERVDLPAAIRGCLFDLDGVLTNTAVIHETAWKAVFDAYLRARTDDSVPALPFTAHDYAAYVDGRPRADGVRAFLASRGIYLPDSASDHSPHEETVESLSARKQEVLTHLLREQGVDAFPGSLRFLGAVRKAGLRTAVVSASANLTDVLAAAGIGDLFEARVDAHVASELGLNGKPSPDTFLCAARQLGLEPSQCAVFEDALAGVAAGRTGHFGLVVGVNRLDQADALRVNGADRVVADLSELLDP
jgi:beta-phosphoglucomutase family hydrolase